MAGMQVVVFPNRNEVDVASMEPEHMEGLKIMLKDDIASMVDLVLLPNSAG